MLLLKIAELQKIVAHSERTKPYEAAGIILAREFKQHTFLSFIETSSKENSLLSFRIRDKAISEIGDSIKDTGLRICGCFHSHILGPARPSYYDCLAEKGMGDLWLIYSVSYLELNLFSWNGTTFRKESFRFVS